MPGDDGLRLDDDERRSPGGPRRRQPRPEPTVGFRKMEPSGPLEQLQLMLQREIFEVQSDT
jgi:hypothetical protein